MLWRHNKFFISFDSKFKILSWYAKWVALNYEDHILETKENTGEKFEPAFLKHFCYCWRWWRWEKIWLQILTWLAKSGRTGRKMGNLKNWIEEVRKPHNKVALMNQALIEANLDHKYLQKNHSALTYTSTLLETGAWNRAWHEGGQMQNLVQQGRVLTLLLTFFRPVNTPQ